MKLIDNVFNKLLLGVGFATLLYVLSYYLIEANYDSWVVDYQQIYRIDNVVRFSDQPVKHDPSVPLIINDSLIKNIRGITHSGVYSKLWLEYMINNQAFEMEVSLINEDFLTLFSVTSLSGNLSDLFGKPNTIVITRALSEKIFGKEDAVGQLIQTTTEKIYEVVAVIENWPVNSHLDIEAMVNYQPYLLVNEPIALNSYGRSGGNIYVKIDEDLNPETLQSEINEHFKQIGPPEYFTPGYGHDYSAVFTFILTPLIDASKYTYAKPIETNSNKEALLTVLILIAVSIFLIGVVNFLIYNNNQTIQYLYESSLKLTFGASLKDMFVEVFLKSGKSVMIISAISFTLYFALFKSLNSLIGLDNQLSLSDSLILFLLIIMFLMAFIASILFILKIKNKSPKQVEKLSFFTGNARKIGQFYVLLQIGITCFLICMSLTMQVQLSNLIGQGKGYDTKNIMVLWDYYGSESQASLRRIQKLLAEDVGIENVSLSGYVPGDNRDSAMSLRKPDSNKMLTMERMNVGIGTFNLFGVEVLAGRLFEWDRQDEVVNDSDLPVSIVVNKKATEVLGYATPSQSIGAIVEQLIGGNGNWRKARIIGVIPDYNFKSAFNTIPSTVFFAQASHYDRLVIKTSNFDKTFNRVQSIWLNINPKNIFDLEPLDDYLKTLYELENKQLKLILFVSLFGLLMSCLGIFNSLKQNYVESQFELNIRKSFGVGWLNIFRIFVLKNFPFLTVGIVLSIPFYWLGSDIWLSKFTVIYPSMFLNMIIGAGVVIVTAFLIFVYFIPDIRKLDVSNIKDLN